MIIIKFLKSYIYQHWLKIAIAFFIAGLTQALSFLDPFIFQKIIDKYVIDSNGSVKSYLNFYDFVIKANNLILIGIGVVIINRITRVFQEYIISAVSFSISAEVFSSVLKHILGIPYYIFENFKSGEILTVLSKAKSDIERLILACINSLFTTIIGLIFLIIYSITVNWTLCIIYLTLLPILIIYNIKLNSKITFFQNSIVSSGADLGSSLIETLRNIEFIKGLGLVEVENQRLVSKNNNISELELKKRKYILGVVSKQNIMTVLIRNIIFLLLLFYVISSYLTIGQFFAFTMYSIFILNPLQEIGLIINVYAETKISIERITQYLKIPKEKTFNSVDNEFLLESVKYENVCFKYANSKVQTLTNINFNVKLGETIAFVGPSGSGKSTLVKLLLGLYLPDSGNITVNERFMKDINLNVLRKQIGLVTQDTHLFSGSILDNIKFSAIHSTQSDCNEVLKMVMAEDFVNQTSDGMATMLGERGLKISEGEKQRLAIARGLIRKGSLLIFDEVTSSLDSITENSITSVIQNLNHERKYIIIIIAHKLNTVMHADCIYVMNKGVIHEQGKHDSLLEKKGLYYSLWNRQVYRKF